MDFRFGADQLAMRDAVRDALSRACPTPVLRAIFDGDDAARSGLWRALHALGLPVLRLPEGDGGLGLTLVDALLPLEEIGRLGVPGPIAETIAAAPLLAGTRFAAALREGARATLVSSGEGSVGREAGGGQTGSVGRPAGGVQLGPRTTEDAEIVVLLDGDAAALVPRGDLIGRPQPSVDGARRLVTFERCTSIEPVQLQTGGHRAAMAATTGTAAVLLGLGQAMLDLSVTHVKTREQFGQPIGAFQAVKHHLADAYVALAFARPLVYRAALSVDALATDAPFHVSMAKAHASDAALQVARHALQVHGAIGYTTEYALHFFLKRTWALAAAWGDATRHRDVMAAHLLDLEERTE